ncbi:uncharacterized protein DSM5745_09806 [Aspergillus mulundensis]|uniref:Uncharacterized protein n=1 Tax=Aspergillus mulundensis TaxID=1810919 RepID=A0A3D8QRG6_9EURO|nr:hypothetical protein DSM5745_09806 [Aspergillus mulundensis]RDW64395.1 hypothetical protein DSM5745_09806 [Aspergillus mulundensis]
MASSLISSLRHFPQARWGFTIYRTTYTPLSDRHFPRIIETINSWTKRGADKDYSLVNPYLNLTHRSAYNLLCARYRPTVMENPHEFNDIPLSSVRSHFETWGSQQDINLVWSSQTRACLVIDDEVVEALADAVPWIEGVTDDTAVYRQNSLRWWVKVVEAEPDLEDTYFGPGDYDGTMMKASVLALWPLWKDITDPEPTMADIYDVGTEGGIYVG